MEKLNDIFPKLSNTEILKLLQNRDLEDITTIRQIENFFKKERGYIFKMPTKRQPVILLLSGGLDSVITWDILFKKYQLEVYPLFIRRGQIRMPLEEQSVEYFSKFYEIKYPDLYHPPKKITTFIPSLEIRWKITQHGEEPIGKNSVQWLGIPVYSSQLVNNAVQYAYYLEITKGVVIRNIFCSFMRNDGQVMKYETLTALRVNMYNICHLTNDFSWQFSSIAIEKELGYFFDKEILIYWAKKNHLPLEKTNSCIKFSYFHCGFCVYCYNRKNAFKRAGIKDKTLYLTDVKHKYLYKIINKILLSLTVIRFLGRIIFSLIRNSVYFFRYRY